MKRIFLAAVTTFAAVMSNAAEPALAGHDGSDGHAMDNQRVDTLLRELTGDIQGRPGFWYLEYGGHPVYVITDEAADRMRIIVQVAPADKLDRDALFRMMQSNFDSALDARYAIAKDIVWSAFVHPLSPLSDDRFRAGFAQAVTLADTYGSSSARAGCVSGAAMAATAATASSEAGSPSKSICLGRHRPRRASARRRGLDRRPAE